MNDKKLYTLPEEWQWCRLGDVCQINPSKLSTRDLSDDLEVSFVPMAAVSDVRGEITAPQRKTLREVKSGFTNFTEGDVLFAKITPCMENGKAALVGELVNHIGYGSTEFFVLRCSEKILNRFVYHLVRWQIFRDEAKSVMSGSVGQQRVSKKFLLNYKLPLPPLDEQQRIVDLLDKMFADLDEAKALAQGVVDGSELRRTAILHKAFTGDLTQLWRDEHGITLDSWQKKFLSDVLISSKQKTNDFSASGLKYVGLENMEKNGGRISFQAANDVRSTKNIFHAGDLLYGKLRPYLNKHGMASFDGVCSTDILVFKARKQVETAFINYFLSHPKFIEYAVANSKGINLPRVSEKIVLNAKILLPPLDEQKEIVRLLDDLLGREQQTKYLATKTLERIELMKKSILALAFRGELN